MVKKIGVLGGGQLGLMLYQTAISYPVDLYFLDPDPEAPCAKIAPHFYLGDFKDYKTVVDFAQSLDVITIEIEQVNIEALRELKKQGKQIIPDPEVLAIIQDKSTQKQFYLDHGIPTAPLVDGDKYPFVQKLNIGGYDGKGVYVVDSEEDKKKIFKEASIFEQKADIEKEIAVIIAKNEEGLWASPVVEQIFEPHFNLVDYILSPANINLEKEKEVVRIAEKLVNNFKGHGLFAVEFFLNKDGSLWVNETAPRLHNSGHVGMEGWSASQFDWLIRIVLNLPLSLSEVRKPAAMLNLIGSGERSTSLVQNTEMRKILKIPQLYLHWYQKNISKLGRKMGHINILAEDNKELTEKIRLTKKELEKIKI